MMIGAVDGSDVRYSDGIAAWHTMIAVKADVTALQRRLRRAGISRRTEGMTSRGRAMKDANLLVPSFHEVFAIDLQDGTSAACRR
jgi:hypothetical protein